VSRPDGLEVGRRLAAPDDLTWVEQVSCGTLTFSMTPEDAARYSSWPTRLYRVGEFAGLRADSFRRNTCGWANGYTVLEEIPSYLAFGPNGAEAVAIVERAVRLDGSQVERLGAISTQRPSGTERDAIRAVIVRHGLPGASSVPDRQQYPLDRYLDNAWVSLAWRIDPGVGPDHLVDLVEGCTVDAVLADPRWLAAERAVIDAVFAAIWADRLDTSLRDWLAGPWEKFLETLAPVG
jgi:hypothetical protein